MIFLYFTRSLYCTPTHTRINNLTSVDSFQIYLMFRFQNTQKQYPPHTMTYPCTHPHTTLAPRFGNPIQKNIYSWKWFLDYNIPFVLLLPHEI